MVLSPGRSVLVAGAMVTWRGQVPLVAANAVEPAVVR
jgi:hypothetical protein